MNILYTIYCQIFPERCPYCGDIIKSGAIACKKCLQKINVLQHPIFRGAGGYRCVSSFIYDGSVKRMILLVKYYDRIQYLPQVAKIMKKDILAAYDGITFDLITFVPMHEKDQKKRGFNQAKLLAKELSKLLGIPCAGTTQKIKRTKKQHRLNYQKRKTNLSGAFKVIDKDAVKGKNILIVDDIVTTGITLGTCCKTLNRAKPGLICCATIANANHRLPDAATI